MTSRFARTALAALLATATLPLGLFAAQPVAAQTSVGLQHSVMASRLHGTWQTRDFLWVFKPNGDGTTQFQRIDRKTGHEAASGRLRPNVVKGFMEGEIRETPSGGVSPIGYTNDKRHMYSWVDDGGRLWIDNFTSPLGDDYYQRVNTVLNKPNEQAVAAWAGKWKTSRGSFEIIPDGANFVAWIIHEDGRKERLAFTATPKEAKGAWDSEHDTAGTWRRKLVQWGDLNLTLSEDGNSFTGWYTQPEKVISHKRVNWTGERVDKRPSAPSSQEQHEQQQAQNQEAANAVAHWPGVYLSSRGSRVTLRRDGTSYRGTGVGADSRTAETFTLAPSAGEMRGVMSGSGGNVAISAAASRQGAPIRAALSAGGTTVPYTLCRIEPDDVAVHSAEGRWARLGNTSVRRESDGRSTLLVTLHFINAGPNVTARPSSLSARLPQHTTSRPAAGYVSGFGGQEEAGGAFNLQTCQDAQITFQFRDVTSAITKLVVRDGIDDTAQFDISAATAAIGQTASSTPPPSSQPPVSQPPASQPAGNSSAGPVAYATFKPLNRIDVRVDRVVVARGYPTHQVHAFVTVKNTSASPQYFTSGFMKAVLADADGAGWERSQPYRASGEPAALFSSTPVIQPGGELKVRYIFLSEPDAQLRTLTLSEGGQRAEFPVGL